MKKKGKILVIDDEDVSLDLLSNSLIGEGYTVVTASSGKQGIEYIKTMPFDLIITDLMMPNMNGIQVIQEAKKIDANVVIIVITGYASIETAQESLMRGAFDYITKPLEIPNFFFTISRAIKFRKLNIATKQLLEKISEKNLPMAEEIEDLLIIYKIKQELASTSELNRVLEVIVERASNILDAKICTILLINNNHTSLLISGSYGLDKNQIKTNTLKINEGISGWVVEHNESILSESIEKDPRFNNRTHERYYTNSIISTPLIFEGEIIGVINANNKNSENSFTDHDLRLLQGVANEAAIAIEQSKLYKELKNKYLHSIITLSQCLDDKIKYTRDHSRNVCKYAGAIAEKLGLSSKAIEIIRHAAMLHDLGKIAIPDYILTKKEELTAEEWDTIKQHSRKGAEVIEPLDIPGEELSKIIKQHHKHYSGKGYPDEIKKEDISLDARIISVADAFDAMTASRPYRNKNYAISEAIDELKKFSGIQFDPKVVDTMISLTKETPELFVN